MDSYRLPYLAPPVECLNLWDRIISSSNHNINNSAGKVLRELKEIVLYEGGFIYIDTVGGAAGSEDFVNGTLSNPVNSMADANILADSLSIPKFNIRAGSTISFVASQEKQTFNGESWKLLPGSR